MHNLIICIDKYNQGSISSSGEIVCILIGSLMQVMVSFMKDVVASHEIVRRVTQGYSGSKFIEFKEVINSMIQSQLEDQKFLLCTARIQAADFQKSLQQKLGLQVLF